MVKVNIDMPKSCYECKFCIREYRTSPPLAHYVVFLYCNIMKEFVKSGAQYENNVKEYKCVKCPLEDCEEG